MPQTFEVELSDGTIVEVESDQQPTEQQVVSALKDYGKPPQVGALKTALQHGAAGIAPGAAFTAAFPLGAAAGGYVPHPVGAAIVGGIGGIATGTAAAILAAKAQRKALEVAVPEFAKKFEQELQAGEEQHPLAAIAGDIASMGPSAKVAPFKLAQLPFRAGVGGTVGAVLPMVTEGRAPTWKDVATGAATGAIYGEGRFNPFRGRATPQNVPRRTFPLETPQRQPEAATTPETVKGGAREEQAPLLETQPEARPESTISEEDYARLEREAIDAGEKLGSPVSHVEQFTGETENEPFARQFMRPTGEGIEVRRRNFRSWLETVPPERRSQAVQARVMEEHIHRHVTGEDAGSYWNSLTGLEKAIETRQYTGKWSRGKYLEETGIGLSDAQMGHEAIRRRMQKLTTGTSSEIAEAATRERWTLKSIDMLESMIREARELIGTKPSKEGLALFSKLDDNLQAARAAVAGRSGEETPAAREKREPLNIPALRMPDGTLIEGRSLTGNTHGAAFDSAIAKGYSEADAIKAEQGYMNQDGTRFLTKDQIYEQAQEEKRARQKPAALQKVHADEAEQVLQMTPEQFSAKTAPFKGATPAGYDFAIRVGTPDAIGTLRQYEKAAQDQTGEITARARAATGPEQQKLIAQMMMNTQKAQFYGEGARLLEAAESVRKGMTLEQAENKHGVQYNAGKLKELVEKQRQEVPAALQKRERTKKSPSLEQIAVMDNEQKRDARIALTHEVLGTLPKFDEFHKREGDFLYGEVEKYKGKDLPPFWVSEMAEEREAFVRKAVSTLQEQRAKAQALNWKEGVTEIDKRLDAFSKEYPELAEQAFPAALQKKFKPDVLTEQMKLGVPVKGQEREAAYPPPTAAAIDTMAKNVTQPAIAAGEIPDFDNYLGQLQGSFGSGVTREKAFWPWLDSVRQQLISLPGDQVRTLLGKLGLYHDVAQALKPTEKDPTLPRIPDATPDLQQFRLEGEWHSDYKPGGKRRPTGKFSPEQQRRLAALGAIYDELASRAGGKPKRERFRTEVGPEDLMSRIVVVEPSQPIPGVEGEFTPPEVQSKRQFERLTPEQATNPKLVGEAVTAEARESGQKVSSTRGLLALRDRINNRQILVSAWKDGRRGPVVTNPENPRGSSVKIDEKLFDRYEPTHVLTLREPTEEFRQVFDSPEAFSKWFGEVGIEGTPGLRGGSFIGPEAAVAREQAGIAGGGTPPPAEAPLRALAGPETSQTARELRMPTFARRGVPAAQLPPSVPGRGAPAQILPPEGLAASEARAGELHPYEATQFKAPSPELEARGINLLPGARGQRPTAARLGLERFRKPVKKGGDTPAAIQKQLKAAKDAAVDQWQIMANDIKATVSRRSVKQDIPRLLDGAENASKQFAASAKQSIILASGEALPEGLTGRAARRAHREMSREASQRRRAAIAYVVSGRRDNQGSWYAYRPNLDAFETKLEIAEPKALAWVNGINPLKRREGRKWLEAIHEMRADLAYAREHWNDEAFQRTAHTYMQEIHDTIAFENAHGSSVVERDNYIPGLYEGAFWSDNMLSFGSRRLLGGQYRMPKKFKNPYDAIVAGPYYLASRDLAELAEHRIAAGHRIVNRGLWMQGLSKIVDPPTQQPVAKEPLYSKTTKTDPITGNTWDKVVWKSPSPEYTLVYPSPGAKPIAVRLGYERAVRTPMRSSVVEDIPLAKEALAATQILKHGVILLLDTFHPFRLSQYMLSMTGFKGYGYKGGYSALTYRAGDIPRAVEQGYLSQRSADWAQAPVEVKTPQGETVTRTRKQIADYLIEQGLNVSKISDALYKHAVEHIPFIGEPYHKLISPYNKWLFDRFVPGMMLESAVRNFEKYNQSHSAAGIRAIARDVVRDTNVYFGNMGRQGVFKSATFRDLAQLTLLAPMWQEGLLMKEIQGATRFAMLPARAMGAPFRKGLPALGATGSALAKGLGAYFVLSQLINLVTRGHLTFQNKEEEHKMDAWIPTGDGKGLWLSPLSVFAEVTHDFIRLGETKARTWDRIVQMGENRLGPIGKMADILLTGKAPTGERFTTTAAQLKSAAAQVTPFAGAVPITLAVPARYALNKMFPTQVSPNPPGAAVRQLFASGGGIKTQTSRTDLQQASKLARDFIEREGLSKETGWQQVMTDEPGYSTLRMQLRNNDEAGARKTLAALRRTRSDNDIIKGMKMWAKRPLTGSLKNEREFIYSLSNEELELYTRANEERQATLEKFYDWMNRQP